MWDEGVYRGDVGFYGSRVYRVPGFRVQGSG